MGLVINISLSTNGCWHLKNQIDAWEKTRLGSPEVRNYVRFDVIKAEPSLLFLTQKDKRRLCSQGGVRLPKMGVTGDDSQQRLLGQHCDAMLEQCCN